MRVHEFASDRFISVYYTHTLGKMKWHPRISTPQFILATSFSIGDLVAGDQHWTADGSAFPILSPEKGYFESGIIVRDVYKFMGILGFGVAYFYRYGHYALDDFVDNSALKITVDLSL